MIAGSAILTTIIAGDTILILFHSASNVLCVIFIGTIVAVLGLNWRMEDYGLVPAYDCVECGDGIAGEYRLGPHFQ